MSEKIIGYLLDGKLVVAPEQLKGRNGTPIYDVNILPYRQTCHETGQVLVEGKVETELFPPPTDAKLKALKVERDEEPEEGEREVIIQRPDAESD